MNPRKNWYFHDTKSGTKIKEMSTYKMIKAPLEINWTD